MKILIVVWLVLTGIVDACPVYGFSNSALSIEGLAESADTIVWVELLSKRVEKPFVEEIEPNSSEQATTLKELLALVKTCRARNSDTVITSFNLLHLVKGNSFELESTCVKCSWKTSNLYGRMLIGQQYVLFYQEGRLIGAVTIAETKDYQRILRIVNSINID